MFQKMKKVIEKFLEDLARENQKVYGKGGLDCCKINRNNSENMNNKKNP
ncbi:hypothetical protein EDD66_102112 [Mobilisporobacter senegalensis]|uniref:Uncharacterized protein n=1 Tax=Mobilisporobacter senegalensis TaxID=1329262 RepID=A0A3N1XW80_9FIRM|nr:LDCC motif putative metal-binding protein [Mobilisporobacter senegalensis]ROR30461.1 hypothetical protein EDD66_102112 [Mobilisporobacter senegalensis]